MCDIVMLVLTVHVDGACLTYGAPDGHPPPERGAAGARGSLGERPARAQRPQQMLLQVTLDLRVQFWTYKHSLTDLQRTRLSVQRVSFCRNPDGNRIRLWFLQCRIVDTYLVIQRTGRHVSFLFSIKSIPDGRHRFTVSILISSVMSLVLFGRLHDGLTVGIAFLLAAQEAEVGDGGRVQEVAQVPQHHPGAVDVAGFEFLHRSYHGHWDFALI